MSDGDRRHGGRGRTDGIELYVLRHAHAGDPAAWHGPDDARPLSARGENQVARVAAFLRRTGVRPELILTSPKQRAAQTAAPVAVLLDVPLTIEPRLGVPFGLTDLERILSAAGDPASAMIVGHDPDFSRLVEDLTGAGSLPMAKGGIARIDCIRPLAAGAGVLRWLVPPDLLKDA